jgi:hypothetical protein
LSLPGSLSFLNFVSQSGYDMETENTKNPMIVKLRGQLTAEIGKNLNLEGYDIFYDHGERSPTVGKIVSSIHKAPAMGEELS